MTVDSEQLGKTAGKDQATEKATWPAVYGIDQSRRDAAQLIDEAFAALEPYGSRADGLKASPATSLSGKTSVASQKFLTISTCHSERTGPQTLFGDPKE
jgi:geranylgeranyl pyrophosphate synthase